MQRNERSIYDLVLRRTWDGRGGPPSYLARMFRRYRKHALLHEPGQAGQDEPPRYQCAVVGPLGRSYTPMRMKGRNPVSGMGFYKRMRWMKRGIVDSAIVARL